MTKETDQNNVNKITFSSADIINIILDALGLNREQISTYKNYELDNSNYIRLRISNHGLFLQNWYDKNRNARMSGKKVPQLNFGQNLAITFAPNEKECIAMNKPFPLKIKNVTNAKTQTGNNVKPQFKVRHICYYSWMLTTEDVDQISKFLLKCISTGENFVNPLSGVQDKTIEWEDISNMPAKKVEGTNLQKVKNDVSTNSKNHENSNYIQYNTMKNNNKALYESIMKDVAKVVKQKLNEQIDFFDDSAISKRFMGRELKFTKAFWENFEEFCLERKEFMDMTTVKYVIDFLGQWLNKHKEWE